MTHPQDELAAVDLGAVAADLREKAGKATAGPWVSGYVSFSDFGREWPGSLSMEFIDNLAEEGTNAQPNAHYIAAANPSTILALLSERDALLARLGEQGKAMAELADAAEPFVAFIGNDDRLPEDMPLTQGSSIAKRQLIVADFRRLRAAILSPQPLAEEPEDGR